VLTGSLVRGARVSVRTGFVGRGAACEVIM